MKRPRFALRSLFIGISLAAPLLGYAQWRRQQIMREVRALESQGFTLLCQDTSTNWLWPIVPKEAKCEYYQTLDGNWKIGSDVYRAADEDAINAPRSNIRNVRRRPLAPLAIQPAHSAHRHDAGGHGTWVVRVA